ncbi:hypothetical protein VTN31DRAFT_4168 [Thermomyces dupontii]|uniref:uncharacterized protein n=1 Tax=Talaromyces thermophilus TaxID=28565 RepID=UPI003742CF5E
MTHALNVVFSDGDSVTVCHDILIGLKYIHSEFGMFQGFLSCINVLLTMEAEIKIANIGDSMRSKGHRKDERFDIEAVGRIAERPRRHRAKTSRRQVSCSPI